MRLLVLGHSASRSGSPYVLLEFLTWLSREHPDVEVDLVFAQGGPLVEDFQSLGVRTGVVALPLSTLRRLVRERMPARAGVVLDPLLGVVRSVLVPPRRRWGGAYDVVYVNSLPAVELLSESSPLWRRATLHVHEMRQAMISIESRQGPGWRRRAVSRYIAASRSSARDLAELLSQRPCRTIEVVEPWVPARPAPQTAPASAPGPDRDEEIPTVLTLGSAEPRKGFDIWVQAAIACSRESRLTGAPAIHWRWVGADLGDEVVRYALDDVRAAGASATIEIAGPVDDPHPILERCRVMFMASREDPFPIAMLEAAQHRLPLVALRGSGGPEEFASKGAGVVVDRQDPNEIAAVVRELVLDDDRRRAMGAAAAALSAERLRDQACERIWMVLKQGADLEP